MASTDHGLRPLWLPAVTGAALWSLYAALQVWDWASQHSAFAGFPAGPREYSPPVPSPVLRLLWLASVLVALAALGVAAQRSATGSGRAPAPVALASGGLLLGVVSIWLTPSRFGFSRGDFVVRPSAEFDAGVLVALGPAMAFVTLCIVLGTQARRSSSDVRAS